jgi:Secretion system C-terminal sorting domain
LAVGTYAVLVTEEDNPMCAAWGYYTVYGPDGGPTSVVESEATNFGLVVYPVPTNEELTIQADQDISTIQLSNAFGQQVSYTKHNAELVKLNVAHLPAGMYFYTVTNTEGNISSGRFMKN